MTSNNGTLGYLTDFEALLRNKREDLFPKDILSTREANGVRHALSVLEKLQKGVLEELKERIPGSPEGLFTLKRLGWLEKLLPIEIFEEPDYLTQALEFEKTYRKGVGSTELTQAFQKFEKSLNDFRTFQNDYNSENLEPSDNEQYWLLKDNLDLYENSFQALWRLRLKDIIIALKRQIMEREVPINEFLEECSDVQFSEMQDGLNFCLENGIPYDVLTSAMEEDGWLSQAVTHYKEQFDIRQHDPGFVMSPFDKVNAVSSGFGYLKYVNEVMRNPMLIKLIDELGRSLELDAIFRKEHIEKELIKNAKKKKAQNISGSLSGIRLGNKLEYALPLELASISCPETELIFAKKFLEGSLLSFDFTEITKAFDGDCIQGSGNEKFCTRGPLVVSVDTSASMKGRNENYAKAVALIVALRCLENSRPCYLINFSVKIETIKLTREDTKNALKSLNDFLGRSFHGGTNLDAVVTETEDLVKHDPIFEKADLLCITDGQIFIEDDTVALIKKLREEHGIRFAELVTAYSGTLPSDIFDTVYEISQHSLRRVTLGQTTEAELIMGSLPGRL